MVLTPESSISELTTHRNRVLRAQQSMALCCSCHTPSCRQAAELISIEQEVRPLEVGVASNTPLAEELQHLRKHRAKATLSKYDYKRCMAQLHVEAISRGNCWHGS
ncbi:hypothetical protein NDU88_002758 [Pleurodeles waltl]|uniref:Uncharacterized protein n=1 Tax=Pleurodeles waltl TaxID=8319 RepID=A0AAV7WM55_PLEWA|nr:hypothetical protein NDU88_002758 [Pleurodeles waltl]